MDQITTSISFQLSVLRGDQGGRHVRCRVKWLIDQGRRGGKGGTDGEAKSGKTILPWKDTAARWVSLQSEKKGY